MTKKNNSCAVGEEKKEIELYDTTLRDGAQSGDANFNFDEKIELFKLLDDFGFDYIEGGWPTSNKSLEIFDLFKKIRKRAKICVFGSTSKAKNPGDDENLRRLITSKVDCACIFGKTWIPHIQKQLKISPEENLEKISESVSFLRKNGVRVFYDAEHYFDSFKENPEYSIKTLISAANAGADRIILCDTNGGALPQECEKIIKKTAEILNENKIKIPLGVHFHNDRGFALANTWVCLPYIKQIQGTINGIGERVGNLDFSSFIPNYVLCGGELKVKLDKLTEISSEAYRISGIINPHIKPFVGLMAFAHKGGIHIDAKNKGASYEHVLPEKFGNKSIILLNTQGGGAGVVNVASQFGYQLDKKNFEVGEKIKNLFEELEILEDKGYRIGGLKAEQYLLIEKYFGHLRDFFIFREWGFKTSWKENKETSSFSASVNVDGKDFSEEIVLEGGPVDAAYKTLVNILSREYPCVKDLELKDFHVEIARRSREESSVRVLTLFENSEEFETVGVSENIVEASIESLVKGLRYHLNTIYKNKQSL